MDHNFLDISPSQRIADQIYRGEPDKRSVEKLVEEVNAYLKKLDQDNIKPPEALKDRRIDPMDSSKPLRNPERMQKTKLILLYLSMFLSHLPLESDKEGDSFNPFEQLKSFVIYSIDLITEKDVTAAILKEHEKLGLLTDLNTWYYRGQIKKSLNVIREEVDKAKSATLKDYRKLFLGLQKLSTFWFSVRNQDIKRVRKSDVLMYKLTRILLEKCMEG